ncbi:coatomer subunit beta'-2-like protein [Tanacetum coccineum]
MLSKNKATIDYSNTSNLNFLRFYFLLYLESDEANYMDSQRPSNPLYLDGDAEEIAKLASLAKENGKNNVAFACLFMLGKLEDCLQLLVDSNRIPEAALMARSYLPSKDSRIVALWRKDLNKACAPAVFDDLMFKVVSKELNPEVNFFRSKAIRNPDAPFVTSALSQGSSMFFPHLIKFQEMLLAAMQQPMPITALDSALANAPPKQQKTICYP